MKKSSIFFFFLIQKRSCPTSEFVKTIFEKTSGDGGAMASGQIRSNMRIEIRVSGSNMWVAETFIFIDGKEVQVQSYRFTRN